jgi:hypothetical protein
MIQQIGRLLAQEREAKTQHGLEIVRARAADGERVLSGYADSPPM